jgi:hypothetical protein
VIVMPIDNVSRNRSTQDVTVVISISPLARFLALMGVIASNAVLGAEPSPPDPSPLIKPIVDLRLRMESVRQQGMAEDASAGTLRGRLGFQTARALDTSLLAEGEFIAPFVSDYNSTVNGKSTYPIVPDPQTTEVNRLYLLNTSVPDTTLVLGRQNFAFDDSRFVSDATWRQNEQTYDAVRMVNRSVPQVTLNLAYLAQTNRAVGKDSPAGRYDGDSYLMNVGWTSPIGNLSLFRYLLAFDQAPTDSSQTTGVHFDGSRALRAVNVTYSSSYAHQSDYAANPRVYSDDYYGFEMSATAHSCTFIAGRESFEGDGVIGFGLPLGANHKFEGWADRFATTPANGLNNRYFALSYTSRAITFDSLSFTVKQHTFGAQHTNAHYGDEWDLMLQAKVKKVTSTLKYASYEADTFAHDTRKMWAQVEYVW